MTPPKSDRLPGPSVPPRRDDICAWGRAPLSCFFSIFYGPARAAMGLLLFAVIALGVLPEPARAQTTATYTVTFKGNWTTSSTNVVVPGSAHFTTLIGAVHDSDVTFWAPGGMATSGVEGVAELGSTGMFKSEINAAAAGTVKSTVQVSLSFSPTVEKTFQVEFSRTHPLLTLLSMIGPSPDWFVGVSGLSLLDGSDAWRSSHTVNLFPYDAGTEDGEEFSLSNPATVPQGTITSIKGQGKFSDTRMARLSFTLQGNRAPVLPTEEETEEGCAVSNVTDDDQSLGRFVECAADSIEASGSFEETLSLLEEFRDDEGNWNDGSTYLVLLTRRGGVYFHAKDREVEDLDWSGILSCEGGGFVLDTQEGCLIEYDGERRGYTHPFSASHVPLAHGENEFVLLGGFDETPEGEPLTGVIGEPSMEAGEVNTDDELREFVEDAGRVLGEAVENPEIDPALLRGILRQEGPWREGDVYIYIMDEMGRVIFDGADRNREQKDEYEKQHVKDLIAEAGEGIVEYTEGGLLRRGYAVRVEVSLDEEEASRVYVVGSGYHVEEAPDVEEELDAGEEPSGSGNGGGGCAVGGSGGGVFGLSLAALALFLTASLKRHSAEDKTH